MMIRLRLRLVRGFGLARLVRRNSQRLKPPGQLFSSTLEININIAAMVKLQIILGSSLTPDHRLRFDRLLSLSG